MNQTQFTIALFVALSLAACSGARPLPAVPDNLKVPANQVPSLEARANGVQIYQCSPSKEDPAVYKWTFKAPEAELFDDNGKKIGKHYAGPTWEANDGSKVMGQVKAQDDGPNRDAIAWLLLSVKSASGNGVFSQTQSIQRLSTAGGKAPPEGSCNSAEAGKEARVPYTAVYYFYVTKP
jgi:hypothetical protein